MSHSVLKTVSMQGTQLSPLQRRQLAFQKQVHQSFMSPVLANQVKQTLKAVETLKEQGAKPARVWFVECQEAGTISVAEWMGF
ncbi:MAG: Transposase [Pseudomonas helleri]|jgi:ABC-type hemin transport system substrate-binding protein|uniref:hypothetical protein n=1 Tax=Pseudomonas helleri TaxID=1608996 RepID=UPI003A0FED12